MAGTQYCWTRIAITLRGALNPADNSYTFGRNSNFPLRVNGYYGPVSATAVRNTLMQPRRRLILGAAGFAVVVSPPAVVEPTPIVPTTARAAAAAATGAPFAFGPTGAGAALQTIAGLLGNIANAAEAANVERRDTVRWAEADCSNGPVVGPVAVVENVGDKTFLVEGTWVVHVRETVPQAKRKPNPGPASTIDTNPNALGGAGTKVTRGLNPAPGFAPMVIVRENQYTRFGNPLVRVNVGNATRKATSRPQTNLPHYVHSPLASHTWDMAHRVDQDFFLTRIITGKCVFRRDVLQVNKLLPDQLRYWLGHPVPQGMARIGVDVRQADDGITYEYVIVDRDRTLRFNPNVFTRVEAVYTTHVTEKGIMDTLFPGGSVSLSGLIRGGLEMVGGGLLRLAGNLSGQIANFLRGAGAGEAMSGFINFLTSTNFSMTRPIPTTQYHIVGRFWGHPGKSTYWLVNDGILFLQNRFYEALQYANPVFGGIRSPVQLATIERRQAVDLAGKFVEIDWTVKASILTGAAAVFLAQLTAARGGRDAPQYPPDPYLILQDPMRGPNLSACVSQALRNPEDAWGQPQDPPWVEDSEVFRGAGGRHVEDELPFERGGFNVPRPNVPRPIPGAAP